MTQDQVRPIEIHGYAIVSDDDMIAASDGLTPVSLRNEKDWERYQAAQARSELVVLARRSHELEPNVRGERRLVISQGAAGLEKREDAWWWNPRDTSWDIVTRILPSGGEVAVCGGQGAFDLFLGIGFDAFHLSRAHGVRLPGGRGVFLRVRARGLVRGRTGGSRPHPERNDPAGSGPRRRDDGLAKAARLAGAGPESRRIRGAAP